MNNASSKELTKKLRLTPVRKAILNILEEKKMPLTISEIQEFLKIKQLSPNKTTLYRQMETLIEYCIVESLSLKNSVVHYEKKTSHHHHFICNSCEDILCIENKNFEESAKNFKKSLQKNGFLVQGHNFSLEGKCKKCTQ